MAVTIAPFRVVVFSLIIAYGIATRKIMEVGLFFRRVTGYAVLTAYLLALYGLVWWLVSTALSLFGDAQRRPRRGGDRGGVRHGSRAGSLAKPGR